MEVKAESKAAAAAYFLNSLSMVGRGWGWGWWGWGRWRWVITWRCHASGCKSYETSCLPAWHLCPLSSPWQRGEEALRAAAAPVRRRQDGEVGERDHAAGRVPRWRGWWPSARQHVSKATRNKDANLLFFFSSPLTREKKKQSWILKAFFFPRYCK